MRSRRASIDQIIAFILIVFVTFVWILFLMLDYWSAVKIKDKMDVIAQEAAHWLSEQPRLYENNTTQLQALKEYIAHVVGAPVAMELVRTKDCNTSEIRVQVDTTLRLHNMLGKKSVTSSFVTYSLTEQNGSYVITIE